MKNIYFWILAFLFAVPSIAFANEDEHFVRNFSIGIASILFILWIIYFILKKVFGLFKKSDKKRDSSGDDYDYNDNDSDDD